ncbi:MAG: hypothetical protein PHF33_11270 [Candidatus Delongbacteria bacterium]|jgi:hypothetical protein|nr:hypothetical protein [Candidatus Delongbacteria bacterium]
MKKIILFPILTVLFLCFSQTDDTVSSNYQPRNSIGVKFSNISGYGLSFSRRLFDNYNVKFGGIVFYDEYVKGHKDSILEDSKNINYDYGIELQRDIFKNESKRIYALGGIFFSKTQNTEKTRNYTGILYTDTDDEYDKVTGGIGVGIEFVTKRRLSFNIDIGYRFEHSDGKESGIPVKENNTKVGLGIGISYLY